MDLTPTKLEGCFELRPRVFKDSRGYFFESYNQKVFQELSGLVDFPFVQDNQAFSSYGVVRGLHMQKPPFTQAKLVRVLQGRILDVAVDVRKDSQTFGQHIAIELTDQNQKQLFIPRGFLHGYSVLSKTALVMYKCDSYYQPNAEDGVHPYDTEIEVDWKIPKTEALVSNKDEKLQGVKDLAPVVL